MSSKRLNLDIDITGQRKVSDGLNKIGASASSAKQSLKDMAAAKSDMRAVKSQVKAERERTRHLREAAKILSREKTTTISLSKLMERRAQIQARITRGGSTELQMSHLRLAAAKNELLIAQQTAGARTAGAGARTAGAGAGAAGFAKGLLPAFGVMAGVGLAKRMAEDANALDTFAAKMGLTTDFVQEYTIAARDSGIASNVAQKGMERFTIGVGEAMTGTGEFAPTLQRLGIALTDASGNARSVESIWGDYANAVQNAGSQQEKLNLVAEGFGRRGTDLLLMLENGAAGFDKMREEAKKTGEVISGDTIKSLAALDIQMSSLGGKLKAGIAPVFVFITERINQISEFLNLMTTPLRGLSAMVGALSGGASFGDAIKAAGEAAENHINGVLDGAERRINALRENENPTAPGGRGVRNEDEAVFEAQRKIEERLAARKLAQMSPEERRLELMKQIEEISKRIDSDNEEGRFAKARQGELEKMDLQDKLEGMKDLTASGPDRPNDRFAALGLGNNKADEQVQQLRTVNRELSEIKGDIKAMERGIREGLT
tara:strand:- start:3892 stop:5535 length:1644 start_codon:yes stop_codon:yes gene_type:complete